MTFEELINNSKSIVFLTGAGISTAAKIPDFRGPRGIWTREKQKQKQQEKQPQRVKKTDKKTTRKRQRPRNERSDYDCDETAATETESFTPASSSSLPSSSSSSSSNTSPTTTTTTTTIDFVTAKPTLTHYAITKLLQLQCPPSTTNKFKYCITQNVDGLHKKSGLSRSVHSCVHGDVFTIKCDRCGCEVFREDKEVQTLSFEIQPEQKCPNCSTASTTRTSQMHDVLLDWEDPVLELDVCTEHCQQADLVICLGTSLRIEPVGSLPLLSTKFVIINLQPTPYDEYATLVVRAKVDTVMDHIMTKIVGRTWYSDMMSRQNPPSIETRWIPKHNAEFQRILQEKQVERQEMEEEDDDEKKVC